MTRDLEEEVALLRAERQALLTALGQQVADRPWPRQGDTVLISSSWDGRALHGQDCLTLSARSRVKVSHVSEEGWLWGTVEGTGESGWFGGQGCSADYQLTVSVPLGPIDPSAVLPMQPPREVQYEGQLWDYELQEFFTKYGVDESAQQALKELPLEEQRRVLETELMNCRNPSAVLLSRIRASQRSRAVGGLGATSAFATAASAALPALGSQRPRSRSPRRSASPAEVEEYIVRHEVDEAAALALRGLAPDKQLEVMSTDLNNCRNPSAVLMGRIRGLELGSRQNQMQIASAVATAGHVGASPILAMQTPLQVHGHSQSAAVAASLGHRQQRGGAGAVGQPHARTEEFISRYGIDEGAAQALRELPAHAQASIIEANLINVRNPSAVVHSRIQAYRQGGGVLGGAGAVVSSPVPVYSTTGRAAAGHSAGVEEYIRRWNLDEKVASELRVLDPEAQRHVMESDIVNARNPSAVVTWRIQDAKSRVASPFASFGLNTRA